MTDTPVPDTPEVARADAAEGLSEEPKTFWQLAWRRFVHHRLALIGGLGALLLILMFLLGPVISPQDITTTDVGRRLLKPSWTHLFGTDEVGRDLFVRTATGGLFSVRIAITVAVLSTAIGTALGAMAGYFGNLVDGLISQLMNLFLLVPAILVLSVFALKYGASPNGIALILAALLWVRIARVVRGVVMQFKEQEFVQAARAAGARSRRIITRHILPNLVGPVLVEVTLLLGTAIVLESTLSFLGLGVRPPTPTLGNLVYEAKGQIDNQPFRVLLPGFLVVTFVLCVNFLGDGLRDALDPKSKAERG
jgi:peptide/nickel transport system permease protein